MPTSPINAVIRHLRRTIPVRDAGSATDEHLLACFVEQQDEAAFAALVQRHSSMVWGVCRRVLHSHHDAEDAFQATFLVLVRKAKSIVPRRLVANWLYGVACTTAHRTRVATARRRARERQVPVMPEGEAVQPDDCDDLRSLLDKEVSRLPEKYRLPIVLCHLQGKPIKEATQELGWPQGTLAGRLARARKMLAKRSDRRGVALSSGSLAVVLSEQAASAYVSPSLAGGTVKAAVAIAAGKTAATAAISANVAAVVDGVLTSMLWTKMKTASAVLFVVLGLAACGGGLLEYQRAAGQQVEARAEKTAKQEKSGGAKAETPRPGRPEGEAGKKPAEDKKKEGEKKESVSVKDFAPVVVQTVPKAGDTKVDAAKVKEVRVTFSKEMKDGNWSWTQISDETFPKTTGKIHYEKDQKTCVLPVKLEAGKTYVFYLNPAKFQGFRDVDGRPALPYLLVFETKP